jgi:interferon-induced GTP-binding protein Mx1
VVCACNADLATAEALRLAAEADPDGERTVGVLTKPDLMDPGTESSVQDILRGKVVKLERHGYFVVRNRGQLSRNVTQGQALTDEAQYFSTHSIFGKLAQRGRFGAPALAQYLAEVLQDAIARDVPEARRLVDSKERDVIAKLQALGDATDVDPSKKRARLVRVATDFAQAVQESCSGKSDGERGLTADVLALYRGFDKDVRSRAPSKNASSYSARVREAVAETRGREAFYGFPSAQVFAGLVADLVDDVRAPAERVVSDVRARVLVAGRAAAAISARRFPALRKKLEELVGDVASEKYEAAKDSVSLFLDAQRHPFAQDLLVSEEPTPRPSFRPQSRPTASNDAFEGQVDFVARQIDRYFGIFATRVSDVIPMSADYALVQNLGRDLALRVADAAHSLSDEAVAQLLTEDPDVARQRSELRDELSRLLAARETLDDYAAGEVVA